MTTIYEDDKPVTIHRDLSIIALDRQQHERTCGYWYCVRSGGAAHTAFAEPDHLIRWLLERGLGMLDPLPAAGFPATAKITGQYRSRMHMDPDQFYGLSGPPIRVLDNAQYTLGIVTTDAQRVRTVHFLNCNVKTRPVFDYATSRALVG